jgi:type VI secretion system protein ImpA
MSPLVEKLLQPIPGDSPCGPDLSSHPRFDELETILKGKPEVDIGSVVKPAEPPEWGLLEKACIDYLGASKHLRVAVMLCCAMLKTRGLPGFRDGLQVLRGLLEGFWDSVHPLLDPDDGNDPLMRLNIVGVITAPRSSYSLGWLQIVDGLHGAPLCRPRGAPPITLDVLLAAAARKPDEGTEGESAAPAGPDSAALAAQLRSVPAAELEAAKAAAAESLEALAGIDAFLGNTLGATNSISFEDLQTTLTQIGHQLASGASGEAAAPAAGAPVVAASREAAPEAAAGGVAVAADAIRGRDDVVRLLEKLCDYYRQYEPGSPVPYVLKRAQKLAGMSFVEAVQELAIATPDTLRPSMGSALEPPPEG